MHNHKACYMQPVRVPAFLDGIHSSAKVSSNPANADQDELGLTTKISMGHSVLAIHLTDIMSVWQLCRGLNIYCSTGHTDTTTAKKQTTNF